MRNFLVCLFLATAASAAPIITSVSPANGNVPGGTVVTIRGSGFSNCVICSPPQAPAILFRGTPARTVTVIDQETIQVVTPPLLPATYDVTIQQFDQGTSTLPQAYTVTGDPLEAFETILLPVFGRPVSGAHGSLFVAVAQGALKDIQQPVPVYGIPLDCGVLIVPPDPFAPENLQPNGQTLSPDCNDGRSRLLYIPTERALNATFNLRVADVSRTDSTLGTEIPIVRAERMTNTRIVLLNVPIDGRYRNTLRIYAMRPAVVNVTIAGQQHLVDLQPGSSIFDPAYGQFSDFPVPIVPGTRSAIEVTIDPGLSVDPNTGTIGPGPPIWAFITLTNNETQQITTITPD